MEIKNNHILLIENSLNELHKSIRTKDSQLLQLQKDKEYLKDSIANNRYEVESIADENEKLKNLIQTLKETQNLLKQEIQEKIIEIKSLESAKRQEEKIAITKHHAELKRVEDKLLESNGTIEELESKNEYLQNIIDVSKNEEELLKYDNYNLNKQVETLKESLEEEKKVKRYEYNDSLDVSNKKTIDIELQEAYQKEQESLKIDNLNLKKQIQVLRQSVEEEKTKRYEQNLIRESKQEQIEEVETSETNKKLHNFEKKFQDSKKYAIVDEIIEDEVIEDNDTVDEPPKPLTEEEILKNNLGL